MQKEYFGDVISKTNIIEYTDIQGFKRIFERQNNEENVTKQSFRSKNMFKLNDENSNTTNLENNTKKHILLDDIIVNLETKQDKENGKSSMAVSVKYKETVILEFEIEDTGEMLLLHGKDFFEEYIGIEKKKIENIINWVSESGTVNLANIDILRNMLLKVNTENKNENMFADMEKVIEKGKEYLLKEIEELDSEKIDARTNVPTKYQGKDLKVDNITITLRKQEYKDILTRVYNKTLYYVQKNKSEFQAFDTIFSLMGNKEEQTTANTIKLNSSVTLSNTGTDTLTVKEQTKAGQNTLPTTLPGGDTGNNVLNSNDTNNVSNNASNQSLLETQNRENNQNVSNNQTLSDDIYMIIKVYNISKNDLKIDIYEKRSEQEEIYMTAIEMRKEPEKGKAEVGIYDYETNTKLILTKKAESEKVYNVLEKAMIQEKENEVKFGSKLEFERTEKTDVSTIEYKANYTERNLKEDQSKSLIYENEVKFGGARIEEDPSRKIVNITERNQIEFDTTVKNVIFTQIQKVLLEKLYKLQNVGNVV